MQKIRVHIVVGSNLCSCHWYEMWWQERTKCRNIMLFCTPEITSVMVDLVSSVFFSVSHLGSHPQSASFEALSNYLNAYLQQPWQSLKCHGTLEHIVGKQIKRFVWTVLALWLSTHSTLFLYVPTAKSELLFKWKQGLQCKGARLIVFVEMFLKMQLTRRTWCDTSATESDPLP